MCSENFLFEFASGNYQNNVASLQASAIQIRQLCVLHQRADIYAAVVSFEHHNAIP